MTLEDPGLFVQIVDHNCLHQALSLPGSPVHQGVDAMASLRAFIDWIINGARNVNGNSQVPSNSATSLAFHQLTPPQCREILMEWDLTNWKYHLRRNRQGPEGARIGEFAHAFGMDGTGLGRATFTLEKFVFA